MPVLGYLLIFGLLGAFGVSVVWALYWSLRDGQYADVHRSALAIFDEDEPEGERSDAFPRASEDRR